jgi:hypothetical protein
VRWEQLFKFPLSGDVVQWINPVTWFASGNQISTNVYLGESSSPETEAEILDRVGTYGKQLGQITDAIIVLLRHLPDRESLTRKESDVIKASEKMANDIADIKEKHKRQAVRAYLWVSFATPSAVNPSPSVALHFRQ